MWTRHAKNCLLRECRLSTVFRLKDSYERNRTCSRRLRTALHCCKVVQAGSLLQLYIVLRSLQRNRSHALNASSFHSGHKSKAWHQAMCGQHVGFHRGRKGLMVTLFYAIGGNQNLDVKRMQCASNRFFVLVLAPQWYWQIRRSVRLSPTVIRGFVNSEG